MYICVCVCVCVYRHTHTHKPDTGIITLNLKSQIKS